MVIGKKRESSMWLVGKLGMSCYNDYLIEISFFLIILITIIVFLLPASSVYSQFNMRPENGIPTFNENEILSRLSKNVSGEYVNTNLGFKINFPAGWSGIEANVYGKSCSG